MAKKTPTPEILYARTTSTAVTDTGRTIRIEVNEPWLGSDPIVHQHRALFSSAPKLRTLDGWIHLD